MSQAAGAVVIHSASVAETAPPPAHILRRRRLLLDLTDTTATIDRGFLAALLRPTLEKIRFDEDYYRSANPDLAEAERKGLLADLHWHYLNFGFFEDRLPVRVEVDGAYYAKQYPDVAIAILEDRVASAQSHFERAGFVEGRTPRAGWSFADLIEA